MTPAPSSSPFPTTGDLLLGRYRITEEIGRGGYSVVYAARDEQVGTEVAVKLLVPPPATAEIARERMRREVQAARGLSHPNVVACYDFLEEGPWSFIVMERIRGKDLAATVRHGGPLPVERVVQLGREVCGALQAAHARGILHRDVKPQNVLLDEAGTARLADFGSARLDGQTMTRTGGIVGTIQYTAPEVMAGDRADARADVYALGLTLYFALAGRLPPGTGKELPPTYAAEGHRPSLVRQDLPEWLDEVIARATAAEPEARFPTAASFDDALAREDQAGRIPTITRCVICQAPEPFGLSVCPSCGGAAHGVGDTLVFVKPAGAQRERQQIAAALEPLLDGRAHREERRLVAGGHRALIRVPRAAAEAAVRQLAGRGIPAKISPASRTWASVPLPFYGLLGGMVVVGGTAGIEVAPLLLWTSPLIAVLLLLAAQYRLRRPAIATPTRRAVFSRDVERTIIETFAELPRGSAQSLLASLVRTAEGAYRSLQRLASPPVSPEEVEGLLMNGAQAARDLSELDESLQLLEEHAEPSGDVEAGALDRVVQAERLRDGLVHKFLEGVTLLGGLRADAAREGGSRSALTELIAAMEERAESRREAVRQIGEVVG